VNHTRSKDKKIRWRVLKFQENNILAAPLALDRDDSSCCSCHSHLARSHAPRTLSLSECSEQLAQPTTANNKPVSSLASKLCSTLIERERIDKQGKALRSFVVGLVDNCDAESKASRASHPQPVRQADRQTNRHADPKAEFVRARPVGCRVGDGADCRARLSPALVVYRGKLHVCSMLLCSTSPRPSRHTTSTL
jgi:hypothetical protein